MGRLEDIAERNLNPKHQRERSIVGITLGLFVLLILGLMVFTNLGARPTDPPRPPHVDGVLLRSHK
ncbi:MAG: hypothetical protein NT062_00455 [Proteobacteria bacterium]|nr:hypothetical protein [Pseudomonadota bacterium]